MTSEVWGARLDGGYLGTDWVKELLADFHSEENRAEMLEKELLNKKTSLEHLRGILCTVADRAEKAEIKRDAMVEALRFYATDGPDGMVARNALAEVVNGGKT